MDRIIKVGKKAGPLLLALIFLSSCVRYQIRHENLLGDGKGPQWLAFRNDFYIPEYTLISDKEYAPTEKEAKMLFNARYPAFEDLIWQKYEKPKRQAYDYLVPPVLLLTGPVLDLFVMPLSWYEAKMQHQSMSDDMKWFPTTRYGYYGLFYGPVGWHIFGPDRVYDNPDWKNKMEAQKKLESLLRETAQKVKMTNGK